MKFVDDDHLIAHDHTTCVRVELVHDVTKKCRFSQSESSLESSSILDRLAFTSEISIGTCCTTPPINFLLGKNSCGSCERRRCTKVSLLLVSLSYHNYLLKTCVLKALKAT